MARARARAGAIVTLVLVACGGGSSSPTDPAPPPGSFAGTWRGELSGTESGTAFTCSVEIDVDDMGDGIFVGGWKAGCGDAAVAGAATITSIVGFTFVNALRSPTTSASHMLGTCGWAAPVSLRGNELTGTWNPPQSCEDSGFLGGPLRLRFAG